MQHVEQKKNSPSDSWDIFSNVLSVSKNGGSEGQRSSGAGLRGGAHWWSTRLAHSGPWVHPQQLNWILLISARSGKTGSQPLPSSCSSHSGLGLLASTQRCTAEPRASPGCRLDRYSARSLLLPFNLTLCLLYKTFRFKTSGSRKLSSGPSEIQLAEVCPRHE